MRRNRRQASTLAGCWKRPRWQILVVDRLGAGHGGMTEAAPGKDRRWPAQGGNFGGLVLARPLIGYFRVYDLAQGGLAVGHQPAIAGLAIEIPRLIGIGLEVEQLWRHADVVDVLELALADHEGSSGGTGRVIFAHDGAFGRPPAHDVQQRGARQVAVFGMNRQADAVDDGRKAIDQGYRLATDNLGWNFGTCHQHRHGGRFLIHIGFAPQSAAAEIVAVVAGVDDARAAGQIEVLERLQQAPDVVIDEAHEPEVGGNRLAHLAWLIEALVVDLAGSHGRQIGVVGPFGLSVEARPGHLRLRVQVVPFRSGDQRKMRAHQRHEQDPRLLVVRPRPRGQPTLGGRSDAIVIALVAGIAAAGVPRQPQGGLARWRRLAQHADRVTDAIDDMQRHVFLAEAIVVLGAAKMQFADRLDPVARGFEAVRPGWHAAVIGNGVIPKADLVHVAAGLEAGPRGHAGRRIAVGVREADAAPRQPVEIGGADHVMAVAAEHAFAVLVRHDEEEISGGHGLSRTHSLSSLARMATQSLAATESSTAAPASKLWRRSPCTCRTVPPTSTWWSTMLPRKALSSRRPLSRFGLLPRPAAARPIASGRMATVTALPPLRPSLSRAVSVC